MMIKKEVRFECKLLEQKKIPHDDKVNQIDAVCFSVSLSLLLLCSRAVVPSAKTGGLEKFNDPRKNW